MDQVDAIRDNYKQLEAWYLANQQSDSLEMPLDLKLASGDTLRFSGLPGDWHELWAKLKRFDDSPRESALARPRAQEVDANARPRVPFASEVNQLQYFGFNASHVRAEASKELMEPQGIWDAIRAPPEDSDHLFWVRVANYEGEFRVALGSITDIDMVGPTCPQPDMCYDVEVEWFVRKTTRTSYWGKLPTFKEYVHPTEHTTLASFHDILPVKVTPPPPSPHTAPSPPFN